MVFTSQALQFLTDIVTQEMLEKNAKQEGSSRWKRRQLEEHQIVVILMKRPGIILARLSFEPSDWSCEAIVSFEKWRQ